ncbi:spore coat protein U domain-containing protein, partial [Escherichia fergusonii]
MNKNHLFLGMASFFLLHLPLAIAVTSSGTVGVTLTLTNGCLINGSPSQNGINFGTLDFGTHPATFSTLTTQLSGASGGNSFTIQCTTADYTVEVTG